MPASSRWRATLSAPRLVRVNTSAAQRRVGEELHEQRALARVSTKIAFCATPITVLATAATATLTGSRSSLTGELPDLLRHRRGEEQGLAARRQLGDDLAQGADEPEVHHLVGLVEHQDLGRRQRDRPLAHAGRGAGPAWRRARRAHAPSSAPAGDARRRRTRRPRRRRGGARRFKLCAIWLAQLRRARTSTRARRGAALAAGFGRAGAGLVVRRRPSCRCRSGRCSAGRGRRGSTGSPGPGSGWAWCSPRPRATAAAPGSARAPGERCQCRIFRWPRLAADRDRSRAR